MLVYGTANPEGFGGDTYEGLYLTNKDIDDIIPTMKDIPVKIEHRGSNVGKVISAWKHNGRMDLLMEIHDNSLESAFVKQFVQNGLCKDLSLGYNVTMSRSPAGNLRASNKKVIEVSIVKTGARESCHIRGWTPTQTHKILI